MRDRAGDWGTWLAEEGIGAEDWTWGTEVEGPAIPTPVWDLERASERGIEASREL